MKVLRAPLTDEDIRAVAEGEEVLISGVMYTARDAAHRRLAEAAARGEDWPVDLKGQILYYTGPCPAAPGEVIGPAGPTTSGRMDPYTPLLLSRGLKAMVGKGRRSKEVLAAMEKYGALYLVTYGGLGVLLADRIKRAEVVAYPDLGPEAIFRLEVENFPAIRPTASYLQR
ncbi:MAG: fumarate hydratase subunit beta [Bacillota bacterium]|jgi:fumarate hydratase subunit beta|nr:fumarate hydratase subunit beta [Bacillota bacterium]